MTGWGCVIGSSSSRELAVTTHSPSSSSSSTALLLGHCHRLPRRCVSSCAEEKEEEDSVEFFQHVRLN